MKKTMVVSLAKNRSSRDSNFRKHQNGFTIIELMIATSVFSIVLLLCSIALIQIGRTYYKGITTIKTQEAARSIIDEISQNIRFSGSTFINSIQPNDTNPLSVGFCVGSQRYSYKLDQQLIEGTPNVALHQGNHVLIVDALPGCNASSFAQNVDSPNGTYRELMTINMRINKLTVAPEQTGSTLIRIDLKIAYGDDDILSSSHDSCDVSKAGTQFCAVSELSTVVQKRI